MEIRLLAKLSLFITVLGIPQLVISSPVAKSVWCSSAIAADIKEIGEHGEHGESGFKGRDGRNSESLTVFADGSPMTLDLTGENGLPGRTGNKGNNALCDDQPKDIDKNLRSSDGGNGGDGGDGGAGGNGGSLTVYATNKEHLKQIYVIAAGGDGGEAGIGGDGGQGCKCVASYWNQETCTGTPGSSDYKCTTSEFKCADGYQGRKGRKGRNGVEGTLGHLTLINLDKSLSADRPEATIELGNLKDRGFTLSKNYWQVRDGATSLFAPGSIISDKYKELIARQEHTVLLAWDAPQPVSDFEEERVILALKGDESADIFFPEDLWLETDTFKRDKVTELFVFNAVWEDEATRLKQDGIYGSGANLELDIIDDGDQSDVVSTDFVVKYRINNVEDSQFRTVYDYRTKQEGQVTQNLITRDQDIFTIHLGKLGIPPEHLQPGVEMEIQVEARRSLGDNAKVQKMIVRDTIQQEENLQEVSN